MTPQEKLAADAERATHQHAYATVFSGPEAQIVLADLAVFCREVSTAVDEPGPLDPLALAREEGKRAVWLRIKNYLAMDRTEIANALRVRREAVRGEVTNQLDMTRNDR